MRSLTALSLSVAVAACSSAPPPKEPTRNPDGLVVTGRARFDAHFKDVRRLENQVTRLEDRVRALSPPVARVLELPSSAGTEDLALALRKVVKRAQRTGTSVEIQLATAGASKDQGSAAGLQIGEGPPLHPRVREALDTAAASVRTAVILQPQIDEAIALADRLRGDGEALSGEAERTFARRGVDYIEAVDRELTLSGHRLRDAIARLGAARAFVSAFTNGLTSATRLGAPSR